MATAMDTVGWIVLFALSELEQNVIFLSSILKLLSSVFLRDFSAVEKKKTASIVASSSSWKLCT